MSATLVEVELILEIASLKFEFVKFTSLKFQILHGAFEHIFDIVVLPSLNLDSCLAGGTSEDHGAMTHRGLSKGLAFVFESAVFGSKAFTLSSEVGISASKGLADLCESVILALEGFFFTTKSTVLKSESLVCSL